MVGNLHVMGLVTFGSKKISSKHINMGSSFEDLDAKSPTVKTDRKSDKRFELQKILNFLILHLMRADIINFVFSK